MCLQRKRKNHFYELNTMKHNWEYKKLGEVASYINGYAFKPEQWTDSGTPIIRIQNLNSPDAPFNHYDGEVPEKVKVKNGDLLISWSASLGAYIWNGNDAFLNQHIFKVVFDKCDIDKFYLKYAVSSKLDAMCNLVHGATMKHIVKTDFDNTIIPLPPLPIQQKIVAELDKVSLIIDKKKQQLKELDNLAQAIFYDMFGDPVENEKGWEVKKLGEVCPVIVDGVHQKPNYTDSGKPFVSVVNINSGYLNLKGCKYVSCDDFLQMTKKNKAERGDVLYSKVGATYGIPALVNTDDDFALYVSVCLMKPNRNLINSVFLKQMMATPFIKEQADNRIKGIGVPDLHLNQIRDFNIILPPLFLQQSFAAKIEAIEKQKELISRSIKEAQTLFDERMDYWFD